MAAITQAAPAPRGGLFSRVRSVFRDREYSEWTWAYIFIAVDMGWSTIFFFWPLIAAFITSLQEFNIYADPKWVGLDNYVKIAGEQFWWKSVLVSFLYTLGVVPMGIIIPLFLSILILSLSRPLQTFFKAAYYLPGVISAVVGAVVLRWIFNPAYGLANWLLGLVGIPAQMWFGSPDQALWVLIIMSWIGGHGFGVILYTAAMGGIPKSLYEAADLDAASWWSRHRNITWPLLKPTTLYVFITGCIGAFQVFAPAMLITGGGPVYSTSFVNYYIFRTFYIRNEFGMAAAMSVFLMLIIMAWSVINYRWMSTNVEY